MFEPYLDKIVLQVVRNTVNFSPSYPTDTDYLPRVFPKCIKKTVYRVCYNRFGQKVSICDYWNGENEEGVLQGFERTCTSCKRYTTNIYVCFPSTDPHHRSSYLKGNVFLTLLNGDRPHKDMKGNEMSPRHSRSVPC